MRVVIMISSALLDALGVFAVKLGFGFGHFRHFSALYTQFLSIVAGAF
jgi:hypothetical protein